MMDYQHLQETVVVNSKQNKVNQISRRYKMKKTNNTQELLEFQESFNQVVNNKPSLVNKELAGLQAL
jgi:hypothetical protein